MTADLSVFLDGQKVTALVDTGADFSIISQDLAIRLNKVKTPWTARPSNKDGRSVIDALWTMYSEN